MYAEWEEDTKLLADDVTDLNSNEDGLADYIEKKLLKRFGW